MLCAAFTFYMFYTICILYVLCLICIVLFECIQCSCCLHGVKNDSNNWTWCKSAWLAARLNDQSVGL